MTNTGPAPEEFDGDRDASGRDEDVRAAGDDHALPRHTPDWVRAEGRTGAKPELAYRWYFAVFSAAGARVGQIHVTATTAERAQAQARRIAPGQLLGEPVRYLPENMV